MPRATVSEATNYPIPTDTLLPAKLQMVEEVVVPYTIKKGDRAGQQAEFKKWTWTFKIYEGEYAGMEVEGGTEPEITNADTPRGSLSLAKPWFETLLGRELRLGEEADTDTLLGLPCQITVKHLEPRPRKDGDGFWFNIAVEDVLPAKRDAAGNVVYDEAPF